MISVATHSEWFVFIGGFNLTEHDDETHGLLGMLSRALFKPSSDFKFAIAPIGQQKHPPEPEVGVIASPLQPVGSTIQEEPPGLRLTAQQASIKLRTASAEQVQSLILESLRQIPDFPTRGVAVTVYGFRPWNAMLNFAPGSASQGEAINFREALADIVHELRTRVEVDVDQDD